MPKKLFFEIAEEKQKRIIDSSIEEFATYGYDRGSTNRIVNNAQICKGSLFKYFASKDDLFFYISDYVMQEFLSEIEAKQQEFPTDLCDRIIYYSSLECDWYIKNPVKYQLIEETFLNQTSSIRQKVEERYDTKGQDIYYKLCEGINTEKLRWESDKTISLLKWILKGLKEDFSTKLRANEYNDVEELKTNFMIQLQESIEIVKSGIYR